MRSSQRHPSLLTICHSLRMWQRKMYAAGVWLLLLASITECSFVICFFFFGNLCFFLLPFISIIRYMCLCHASQGCPRSYLPVTLLGQWISHSLPVDSIIKFLIRINDKCTNHSIVNKYRLLCWIGYFAECHGYIHSESEGIWTKLPIKTNDIRLAECRGRKHDLYFSLINHNHTDN